MFTTGEVCEEALHLRVVRVGTGREGGRVMRLLMGRGELAPIAGHGLGLTRHQSSACQSRRVISRPRHTTQRARVRQTILRQVR